MVACWALSGGARIETPTDEILASEGAILDFIEGALALSGFVVVAVVVGCF
jgi:hypothetical protein